MDICEAESAQVKEEDTTFPQIIDNDIKTEILEEDAREIVYFIKCEMCKENSDNETDCVHVKNDRLSDIEQDDKMQVQSLSSADGLHNNRLEVHVKHEVENTDPSSSQKEKYSIMKLINAEVTVKEEEFFDSPERLCTNIDFIECETGEVKTEVDDIFCEYVNSESVKEEPPDDEASLSSGMMAQDENSNEDFQPGFSTESQEGCLRQENETNGDTFQCQICSKICPTKTRLAKHNISHSTHIGESLFHCRVCFKSFIRRGDLVAHKITHTGEKRFNCKLCSKSFARRSHLARHERTHTGEKPFQCKVCYKTFSTSSGLVGHGITHTGEKPFTCKVCSKSFSRPADLKRHGRIHAGEKPFNCKVCTESFSSERCLATHENSHIGEKPFICRVCSESFFTPGDFVNHYRTHTG